MEEGLVQRQGDRELSLRNGMFIMDGSFVELRNGK